MNKSERAKRARKTTEDRLARLKTSGMGVSVSGRVLQPGTPEYDREIENLVKYLSAGEIEDLLAEQAGLQNKKQ